MYTAHTGGDISTVVDIHATDNPMHMPALQPLLTDNTDRLHNQWPFTPPSGDPSTITKADYLALLMSSPALSDYQASHGQPGHANSTAWEAVPIFLAAWQGTHDPQYLTMAVHAVENMCAGLAQIALPIVNPPEGYYRWGKEWAYTFAAIQYTKGTPQYETMMAAMWTMLGQIVDTWPILDADGAAFDLFATAFWYDGALQYYPHYNPHLTLTHAEDLQFFVNKIWNAWSAYQGTDEDDPDYGTGSLLILDAWCQLPGKSFPADLRLWRHYAEQIANDGTCPAYGDGGTPGQYFRGLLCAEITARRTPDGRYKWLAHRAFWNGRGRLSTLRGGSYLNEIYTALAYLHADETIQEQTCPVGVTLRQRQWRDLAPVETRQPPFHGRWVHFQPQLTPSKLIFRAGTSPTDACLVMQVGQFGGHGHMDAGAITYYGSEHALYCDYATLRHDSYQEAHNIFTLRDPASPPVLWCGVVGHPADEPCLTTEEIRMPTMGTTTQASYARILIMECLGND